MAANKQQYGSVDCYDQDYINHQVPVIKRWTHRWFRPDIVGLENLPDTSFIAVGNHSGSVLIPDTYLWLSHYHMLQREPRLVSLTHPGIFDFYPKRVVRALAKMGAIKASAKNAYKALAKGYALQIYPGGDRDACRPFYKSNRVVFNGSTSYVKLAQKTGVPIVPIVSTGIHRGLCILSDGNRICRALKLDKKIGLHALPIALCLPWGLTIGPIPYLPLPVKAKINVLPAIDPSADVNSVDKYVQAQMNAVLQNKPTLTEPLEQTCDV